MGQLIPPLVLGCVFCAVGILAAMPVVVRYVFVHCGLNIVTATFGMAYGKTGLFFKSRAGSIPLWAMWLWWPWLLLIALRMRSYWSRHTDIEAASEVHEGLYLGSYPTDEKCATLAKSPNIAVVDVTCELPRRAYRDKRYLNIPSWDGMAPTVEQIDTAVEFVREMRAQGCSVLVHCAFGIGRSATVMCAVLTALGICPGWEQAYAYLATKRRIVRLNARYKHALREWSIAHNYPSGSVRSPKTSPKPKPEKVNDAVAEGAGDDATGGGQGRRGGPLGLEKRPSHPFTS